MHSDASRYDRHRKYSVEPTSPLTLPANLAAHPNPRPHAPDSWPFSQRAVPDLNTVPASNKEKMNGSHL